MAAKSIAANKGRSALTMLGVIIGLAAVIILVSYAQGQNMALRAYYESMGTNTITVSAYSYRGGVDVASALYDYCLQLDDLVLGVSPTGYIYSDPVIKFESKTIARQWQNMGGGAMMSSGEYPNIVLGNDKYGLCNDYKIAKGRDLSYLDIEKENQVCVLGSAVADELFGFAAVGTDGEPLGIILALSDSMKAPLDSTQWGIFLFVEPQYRNRGIGRALVRKMYQCARENEDNVLQLTNIGSEDYIGFWYELGFDIFLWGVNEQTRKRAATAMIRVK